MDARTRAAVRSRAGDACEYCRRKQVNSPYVRLQMEHIVPLKHGGSDELDNLALACAECNLKKSSDLAGLDPETGTLTRLFNPRHDGWSEHFEWTGVRIIGLTSVGRTTIRVLDLNSEARLRVRRALRRQ